MAIECKRCGGSTTLETVIKLRRGLFGFRETRSQGAYCATCKLSGSIDNAAGMQRPIAPKRQRIFATVVAPCAWPIRLC
jgi:hypothetical protein